jgi:transposase-like protein
MKLGIHLHLAGLSLAKTVSILEFFGIYRCRSTVHYWVKKSDIEPRGGHQPEKIALDETVIKIDGEQHWLFAAVDPDSNDILHVGLYTTRTTVATKMFLNELQKKHDIEDAEFFVDGAPWLHAGLFELGVHFRHETHGDRNPVERVFQEIKRRTDQFYNNFPNADPETVESWLKAVAWEQNALN